MTGYGIIDPAKVVKSALINAVSTGEMILTTDVIIADKPEKNHLLCLTCPYGRHDVILSKSKDHSD
jgi:chaperonin GroEL (HSP60 family)